MGFEFHKGIDQRTWMCIYSYHVKYTFNDGRNSGISLVTILVGSMVNPSCWICTYIGLFGTK